MECPNCSNDTMHLRFQGNARCTFCGYDSGFPHIMPPIPTPMMFFGVDTPEYKAHMNARQIERDSRRGFTYGT